MLQATVKAKAVKKPTQYAKNAKVGDVVHIKGSQVSHLSQLRRWFGSKADVHWFTGAVEDIVNLTVGKTKTTMYEVRYELPDGTNKLLRKKNIHHYPGAWVDPDPPPRVSVLGAGHTRVPTKGRLNPLFVDSDDSTADTFIDTLYARQMEALARPGVRVGRLKLAEPSTDDDSSVDSVLGTFDDAPPHVPPIEQIDGEERSRSLLNDDVSEINESQLPNDSQGSYADGEPSIRPVTISGFVKPAFKNDYDWFTIDEADDTDTNGSLAPMNWRFIGADGEFLEANDDMSDSKRTPLDYFLASMPPTSIKRIPPTKSYLNERRMNLVWRSYYVSSVSAS
jgi:hypothetical protein